MLIIYTYTHTHTHTHTHTYTHGRMVWQICTQTHFDGNASANTNTHLNKHTHNNSHTDTQRHVTLVLHCVCLLALFHPSLHDSQSLLIRAMSASTEKSMVKYINKNTIKAIEWKGGNKWPAEVTRAASRGCWWASQPQWKERRGWSEVSFVSSPSFSLNTICAWLQGKTIVHVLAVHPLHNDLCLANYLHLNLKIVQELRIVFQALQKKHNPVSHHRSLRRTQMHSWPLEPPAVSFRGLSDHE